MVISQPPGNNPSYYYHCFTNAASIALNASGNTLCSIHRLQHRVTHRNGAINIFYTNQIHGGIISRLFFLFILSLHALALHLAVKYYFQIFLYEDLSTLLPHTSVPVVFPSRMPAGPHFVTQPILLSENIPNI